MTKVICVDLDGTLIYNDVSVESAKQFAAAGIFNIFKLSKWIFRGLPYTKCRIAECWKINPEELRYNSKLIDCLNKKKQDGYSIFLATGSTKIYAETIAKHLGIFDGVFASDDQINLVGTAKAEKLSKTFGEFIYIGNSIDDILVWEKSAESVIVNPDKGVLEKMKNKEYQLFEQLMRTLGDIAHSLISEKKSDSIYSEVFLKWREIVGAELADTVVPHKIVKMDKKNLLIVRSQNGCPVELQHDSLRIIQTLNKYFECDLFSIIRVIQK